MILYAAPRGMAATLFRWTLGAIIVTDVDFALMRRAIVAQIKVAPAFRPVPRSWSHEEFCL